MIILLGSDSVVINVQQILAQKYPNDLLKRGLITMLNKDKKVVTEKNGEPVKRITFVGHAGLTKYGGKSPENIANEIIDSFKQADSLSPQFTKNLTHIDLIGCNNGHVSSEGTGMSVTIARRLLEAGYNIQVNSFTNMSFSDPTLFYVIMIFPDPDKGTFSAKGLTKSNYENYYKSQMNIEELEKDISALREKLALVKNEGRILVRELEQLENKNDSDNSQTIEEVNIKIANKEQDYLAISEEINNLSLELDKIKNESEDYLTEIISTEDVRNYFDTDPQCNFTSRIKYSLGSKKGKTTDLFRAVKENDQNALLECIKKGEDVNLPNQNGLTPLFIASKKGHIDCVLMLLRSGANKELAPTFNINQLYNDSGFNGENKERLISFVENKYGKIEGIKGDMIQISASEIAGIMGRNDIKEVLERDNNIVEENIFSVILEGNLDAISRIIKNSPEVINKPSEHGFTPIALAICVGDLKCVEFLVTNGANPNQNFTITPDNLRETLQGLHVSESSISKFIEKKAVDRFIEVSPSALARILNLKDIRNILSPPASSDVSSTVSMLQQLQQSPSNIQQAQPNKPKLQENQAPVLQKPAANQPQADGNQPQPIRVRQLLQVGAQTMPEAQPGSNPTVNNPARNEQPVKNAKQSRGVKVNPEPDKNWSEGREKYANELKAAKQKLKEDATYFLPKDEIEDFSTRIELLIRELESLPESRSSSRSSFFRKSPPNILKQNLELARFILKENGESFKWGSGKELDAKLMDACKKFGLLEKDIRPELVTALIIGASQAEQNKVAAEVRKSHPNL